MRIIGECLSVYVFGYLVCMRMCELECARALASAWLLNWPVHKCRGHEHSRLEIARNQYTVSLHRVHILFRARKKHHAEDPSQQRINRKPAFDAEMAGSGSGYYRARCRNRHQRNNRSGDGFANGALLQIPEDAARNNAKCFSARVSCHPYTYGQCL